MILPISWAYGAALFVYEDGCLEWTGITGLSPTYITNSGPAGLDWTIPLFTLTIMLGLALDPWWMKSRGDFSIFHHGCRYSQGGTKNKHPTGFAPLRSRLTLRHWSDDELLPLFEEPLDSWPEDNHGKIPLFKSIRFWCLQTWQWRISPRLCTC